MVLDTKQKIVVHYIADGEVQEFNFNFQIFEAGDLDVYLDETLTDSGYNVTINEKSYGGKVVFAEPPSNGTRITIIRNLEIKRTSDFQEGGAFRAKVINHELDYQVATLQQLDEKIGRSMIYPPYAQEGVSTSLPLPSAGKALVWNQEASALTNSLMNIDNVYTEVMTAQTESKNSEINAKTSELNAKQSELIALDSAKKLKIATYGNIGDIKYTTRTDIPSGGAWCDGAEYTQAAFPHVYQMLIDGKISSIDFASFEECLSANGVCGLFALDTATTRFKVPKLSDAYIKAGQAPSMFAAESLPNIKGNTGYNWGGTWGPSGVFASASGSDGMFGGTSGITSRVDFNASRVSSTYQDGAKVNPDHVVYRAYVILYASAAEASVAQAQEFMTALGNKANVGLDNITAGAKNLIAGLGMPSEKYIDLELKPNGSIYTAQADGYINIYKMTTADNQYVSAGYTSKTSGTAEESSTKSVITSWAPANSGTGIILPVKKGINYFIGYTANGNLRYFRLFLLEGGKE